MTEDIQEQRYHSEYRLANTIKKAVDMNISVLETIAEASHLKNEFEKANKNSSYKERVDYVVNGLNIWYNIKR